MIDPVAQAAGKENSPQSKLRRGGRSPLGVHAVERGSGSGSFPHKNGLTGRRPTSIIASSGAFMKEPYDANHSYSR